MSVEGISCVKVEFHLASLLITPAVSCNHWRDVTLTSSLFCVLSLSHFGAFLVISIKCLLNNR